MSLKNVPFEIGNGELINVVYTEDQFLYVWLYKGVVYHHVVNKDGIPVDEWYPVTAPTSNQDDIPHQL